MPDTILVCLLFWGMIATAGIAIECGWDWSQNL